MANNVDYKEVLRSIQDRYPDPQSTYEFFLQNKMRPELGIVDIDERMKKADLRGEKSPSTVFYGNLKFIDYGVSNRKEDVVSLIMRNTNLKFPQAVELLCSWQSQSPAEIADQPKVERTVEERKKVAPYSQKYIQKKLEARKEKWDIFVPIRNGLLRGCSAEEKKTAMILFDIGLDGYIPEDGEEMVYRAFIPEYDENKVPYGSFRYNRTLDPKGLLRANAQRVLFGSHLLKMFDLNKPIIVSEGHSDTVVNNAKKMQTVTTGSSTTAIGAFLHLLAGKEIHFYPDADQPGMKGVTQKILEVITYNKTVPDEQKIKWKVFWWGETFIEDKMKNINLSKIDSMPEVELRKIKQSWWFKYREEIGQEAKITLEVLEKHQRELLSHEKVNVSELPEELFVSKWYLISRDCIKQGFDWIDFHEKYKTLDKYHQFIKKYKY